MIKCFLVALLSSIAVHAWATVDAKWVVSGSLTPDKIPAVTGSSSYLLYHSQVNPGHGVDYTIRSAQYTLYLEDGCTANIGLEESVAGAPIRYVIIPAEKKPTAMNLSGYSQLYCDFIMGRLVATQGPISSTQEMSISCKKDGETWKHTVKANGYLKTFESSSPGVRICLESAYNSTQENEYSLTCRIGFADDGDGDGEGDDDYEIPPDGVENLTVTYSELTGYVTVKWDEAPRATSYKVERWDSKSQNFVTLEDCHGYTQYVDKAPPSGTTCKYKISAQNRRGFEEVESETVTIPSSSIAQEYTIIISDNGGTGGTTKNYTKSTTAQIFPFSTPKKGGYVIASWSVGSGWAGTKPTVSRTSTGYEVKIPANTYGSFTITPTWERSGLADFAIEDGELKKYNGVGGDVSIPDGVTSIGEKAFYDYRELKSVTIPASVTSIGYGAFCGCEGLSLVTMVDGVTSIGGMAFRNCDRLPSVTIPATVMNIESNAFTGCSRMNAIIVADGNVAYSSLDGILYNKAKTELILCPEGKIGEVTIASSVTRIVRCAFYDCSRITSVTLQPGVTEIGDCAFEFCGGLKSVTIPSSVTSIGNNAFLGCIRLESLTIPPSVANIGAYAFENCDVLASVTIPLSVTNMGAYAFMGCVGLKEVTIQDGVPYIGSGDFLGCFRLESVAIPPSVANIGEFAFEKCDALTTVYVTQGDADRVDNLYSFGKSVRIVLRDMPVIYKISFLPNADCEGTVLYAAKTQGVPLKLLDVAFTRMGYTQTGWSKDESGCSKDYELSESYEKNEALTLYPYWTANSHKVKYVTNGGTLGAKAPTGPAYGTAFEVSVPTLTGYTFAGWTVSGHDTAARWGTSSSSQTKTIGTSTKCVNGATGSVWFKNLTSVAGKEVTLTANWTANSYKVKYVTNGGTLGAKAPMGPAYGTAFEVSAPTLTGYTFAGWTVSGYDTAARWGTSSSSQTKTIGTSTKCVNGATGSVWFKNLTSVAGKEVTLTANWEKDASADFVIENGVLKEYTGEGGVVEIPSSVVAIDSYAFDGNTTLTSVKIPSSVTRIGYGAFRCCEGLTSVMIPASVTDIGGNAFEGCSGMMEFVVADGNQYYCSCDGILYNKAKTVLIQCPAEKEGNVTMPDSVRKLESPAFSGCRLVTSVKIPLSVTSIPASAFSGSGLVAVTIPSSVTDVGNYAFALCDGLASVEIQEGVTNIGYSAFMGCDNLAKFVVANDNPSFCACDGILYNKEMTELIQCPERKEGRVVIPNGVMFIGRHAFEWCVRLTSVTIPSSVTSIGYSAFSLCTNLTSVVMQEGVEILGNNAFWVCENLNFVAIPSSMSSIGNSAFDDCCALTTVYVAQGDAERVAGLYPFDKSVKFVELAAPAEVVASDGADSDCVVVSWPEASGATSYDLYRSTSPDRPETPFRKGVTSPYDDITAEPGIEYHYWVAAVNPVGSLFSSSDTGYRAISLELGRVEDRYTSDGGNGSVAITANTSWSASVNVDWITFGTKAGDGDATLTYTVAKNAKNNPLVGTITVTAGAGTEHPATKTITVSQEGVSDFEIENGVLKKYNGVGGDVTVPIGVTSIGWQAFSGCSALTSVILPDDVKSIENYAFYNCSGLKSIEFPDGLTSIGDDAFYACISLASAKIPSSVTSIGDWAFYRCEELTSLTIPASVTSIGDKAFLLCRKLKEILVETDNEAYASIDGILYDKATSQLLQCPAGRAASVTIPSGTPSIGEWAFYSCMGLTSVMIEPGLTSVGESAFAFCSGLTSVTIPSGVTNIASKAFYYCSKIESMTLPSSLESIDEDAFASCNKLKVVYVPSGCAGRFADLYPFDTSVEIVEMDEPDVLPDLSTEWMRVGWAAPVFLSDSPANSNAVHNFSEGNPIYLFNLVKNAGEGDLKGEYDVLHEVVSANGDCVASYTNKFYDGLFAGSSIRWEGSRFTILQGLAAGEYTYRCTLDSRQLVDESDESNNVCTYSFAVSANVVEPPSVPSLAVTTWGAVYSNTSHVEVTWSGGVGATSFNLYRSTSDDFPSTSKPLVTFKMASDVTEESSFRYRDNLSSGLIPGVRYYYWIVAVNSEGTKTSNSDWGNILVSLSFDEASASYTAEGGQGRVLIAANTLWSAVVDVPWITLVTKTGSGRYWLIYKVAANSSANDQFGTITVTAGAGTAYPVVRTFTVKIEAAVSPIPPLPPNPTPDDVRAALTGSADARLQSFITEPESYNAYREWAGRVKSPGGLTAAGTQAVKASPNAWTSFATDSAALLAKMPSDEDLKVEEFKPSAMAGSFDFTVSVKDVTIGDKASVDNLKKLFGLEGAESLDTAAFSSENVSLDFREPQDGKLKFTATPAVDNAMSFFMKVKVK